MLFGRGEGCNLLPRLYRVALEFQIRDVMGWYIGVGFLYIPIVCRGVTLKSSILAPYK